MSARRFAMGFVDWSKVPINEIAPGVRLRTPHGERVMIAQVEIDPGAVVPPHEHPHEQAGMVIEGRMELTIGGESRVLSAGEAYLIPGGIRHSARSVGGPCRILDIFSPIREDYARGTNDFVGKNRKN
jgi:quercetin dioxygenase-like cupin family protein